MTSLNNERATAEQLLALTRRHWGASENGLLYVRDETFGEDRSTIVCGHAPQNLAALRNAVLNWLRHQKTDNIAATLRSFARNPLRLLRKLDYPNETVALPLPLPQTRPIVARSIVARS